MWFLYLVCLIIALIIDYIIAKKFSDIAEMKGHEGGTYFWVTFLFGLVGMLMVLALPNIKHIATNKHFVEPSKTTTPIEEVKHSWRCDNCKKMTSKSPCEHCGYNPEKSDAPYWCGNCGYSGPYDNNCPKCNSSLKRFNINKNQ
jgi:predicted RNA-binding Zn-ribbon protein involved in translation (DUF1610 family)